MNVLKIATAGSVDDGKSTLIGRILYDTKSLTDDKLEAIEEKSKLLKKNRPKIHIYMIKNRKNIQSF